MALKKRKKRTRRIGWLTALTALAGLLATATVATATIVYPPLKYGTQTTIYFGLYDSNSPWRAYDTAPAANDVYLLKDGGTPARTTNAVTRLGNGVFTLTLTATEMSAKTVVVDVNDHDDPPLYGDEQIVIPTFGHASALQPFDLASATVTLADGGLTAAKLAASALTAVENQVWNALTKDHKIKNTLGEAVQKGGGGGSALELTGTAAGGTANTIILAAGSAATDGAYVPSTITLLSGAGAPAVRNIIAYTGTARRAYVDRDWPGASPGVTTEYLIRASSSSMFASEGLAQGGDESHIIFAAGALDVDDLTGWVQLRSGTGSPDTQYVVDFDKTTQTATISGTWTDASPSTDTYYVFVPIGSLVSDTTIPVPGLTQADLENAVAAIRSSIQELEEGGITVQDILTIVQKLDTMLEADGKLYRWTRGALSRVPGLF